MSMSDDSPIGSLRILHIEANDMDALLVLRCLRGVVGPATRRTWQLGRRAAAVERRYALGPRARGPLHRPFGARTARALPRPVSRVADCGSVPSRDALSWSRLGLADLVPKQPSAAHACCFEGAIRRAVMVVRPTSRCRHTVLTTTTRTTSHSSRRISARNGCLSATRVLRVSSHPTCSCKGDARSRACAAPTIRVRCMTFLRSPTRQRACKCVIGTGRF